MKRNNSMLKKLCGYNKLRGGVMHDEHQYINLIEDILTSGTEQDGRNGVTKAIFGTAMHFSLKDGVVPFMTTKRLAWKTCLKELLWFIRGDTNNKHLKEQNVHIWDANGSRDFLDSRGLIDREEDDLGPIYGFQWRHFNADYYTSDANYNDKGVDQLKMIIDALKDPKERYSRRLILSSWNPCQLSEMALPPCHIYSYFG
jgi:thymidylate synthase